MLIIFSGYNQRAVIAFLRCLKKYSIDEYVILARDANDPILFSEYSNKVFYIRENVGLEEKELSQLYEKIVAMSSGKTIIIPSTEALNRYLVKNKNDIEKKGVIVPLVNEQLYSEISDKHSFWKVCYDNGLFVPKLMEFSYTFERRYVAKPIKYYNHGRHLDPVIVKNKSDHENFVKKYNLNDFDIQEYVEGESYYLLYYFTRNGAIYSYSQRNLAQQPGGKSIIAAMCSHIHDDRISSLYVEMLKRKGFYGFIMIELRKKNDEYYMIEANPRMWGPIQLCMDAQVPILEAFLYDYNLIDSIPTMVEDDKARYLWSGGIGKTILDDQDCVWLEGGRRLVTEYVEEFISYDIYNRNDTKEIFMMEKRRRGDKR